MSLGLWLILFLMLDCLAKSEYREVLGIIAA